jgi:hypothetical protein
MILVPSSSSFFPMVGEFHGTPVDNVTIFSFPEYSLSIPAVQSRPFPRLCRKWAWTLLRLMESLGRSHICSMISSAVRVCIDCTTAAFFRICSHS